MHSDCRLCVNGGSIGVGRRAASAYMSFGIFTDGDETSGVFRWLELLYRGYARRKPWYGCPITLPIHPRSTHLVYSSVRGEMRQNAEWLL